MSREDEEAKRRKGEGRKKEEQGAKPVQFKMKISSAYEEAGRREEKGRAGKDAGSLRLKPSSAF